MDDRAPVSFPTGTTVVSVQVNTTCQLSCAYCPAEFHAGDAALTPRQFLAILAAAERAGCRQLALGGGEPTAWPYLRWAVDLARRRGFTVALTTNAVAPERLQALPGVQLSVSAPKGRWRDLGRRPETTVNVVHIGGRWQTTVETIRQALAAGYRRLALLPYKGANVAWRVADAEIALLFWLAGQLGRLDVSVALDSYAYRRGGLATSCGEGLVRVDARGVVQPCCFADCEFAPDRHAAFRQEVRADRAARPIRATTLIENSEIGYVVPLSDSLEVSLCRLSWEAVLRALDDFRRIAASLGPEAEAAARTIQPQMDDTAGAPPPPMLGTLDERVRKRDLQRVLDAATTFPLQGRRVRRSLLLREEGEVTREMFITDLAASLLDLRPDRTLPQELCQQRSAAFADVFEKAWEFSYQQPIFGAAFVDDLRRHLAPAYRSALRRDRDVLRTWVSQPEQSDASFLSIAIRTVLGDAPNEALCSALERLPTLAERLATALALLDLAPNAHWLRPILWSLRAEANQRYTPEGRAAVRRAFRITRSSRRPRRALAPAPQPQPSRTVDGPVPERLAAHRRHLTIAALGAAIARYCATVPVGTSPRSWKRDLLRVIDAEFAFLSRSDAVLAEVVLVGDDWPNLIDLPNEPSPRAFDHLYAYFITNHQPEEIRQPASRDRWVTVALERFIPGSDRWLQRALEGRSEAERLAYLVALPAAVRARPPVIAELQRLTAAADVAVRERAVEMLTEHEQQRRRLLEDLGAFSWDDEDDEDDDAG